MTRVGLVLSAAVLVAWAALIATWPFADAQAGIGYVFLTIYAVLALGVVWGVVAVIRRLRRR